MLQSELVRQTGLSRSRTSEILSLLEKKSLVSRFALGKNYRVLLEIEALRGRRKKHLRLGFTRSAEYPFIVPFRKRLRDDMGLEINLQIYDNGLDVARDLSLSRLDLGISPILTSFMYCSIGAPFKIIAPAGSGGSSIVSRKGERSSSQPRVATTKLSTMELLLKSSMRGHFLPEESRATYASSPHDIMKGITSRRFDAACVWEPYATMLAAKRGLSRIVSYSEIEDHVCCTLSAGNHLGDRAVSKITERFVNSIQEYSRAPDHYLEQYSQLTGFDLGIMRRVSHEYNYSSELDPHLIARQFQHAGIQTPNPATVKEMIRPAE